MWIAAIDIADHNLAKLETKHGVTLAEVEEACYATHIGKRGRAGTSLLYGRTAGGRYLLVVLVSRGGGIWSVVTARDMTERERRGFRAAGGG